MQKKLVRTHKNSGKAFVRAASDDEGSTINGEDIEEFQ